MRFPFRQDKPVPRITSAFGVRRHPKSGEIKNHNGVDFGAAEGTNLYAIESGTVIESRVSDHPTGGFGEYVKIDHGKGVVSLYAHMVPGSRTVKKGDVIDEGDLIGKVGESGYTTGAHLHLEITVNGKYVDPVTYIRRAMNAERAGKPLVSPVRPVSPAAPAKPVEKAPAAPKTYTVKSGDTLTKIARTYKTTVAVLKRINAIENANTIRVGQVIKLP